MLLSGVIQLTPSEIALVVAVLVVVVLAFAATGGAIACLVARRRGAFWLGSVTCPATALLLADALGGGLAVLAGWASSGLVGLVLHRREDSPTDPN